MSLAVLLQAAALSTPAPADPWAIAGRVLTVATLVSSGAALFFWRAIGRAHWCAMLSACRPDLKAVVDEIYHDRITTADGLAETVGIHTDQIEALEASIEAQGKALRDSLTDALHRQTESMERIARTSTDTMEEIKRSVEKVHDEAAACTEAIADISGFLRGKSGGQWTGVERRTARRK